MKPKVILLIAIVGIIIFSMITTTGSPEGTPKGDTTKERLQTCIDFQRHVNEWSFINPDSLAIQQNADRLKLFCDMGAPLVSQCPELKNPSSPYFTLCSSQECNKNIALFNNMAWTWGGQSDDPYLSNIEKLNIPENMSRLKNFCDAGNTVASNASCIPDVASQLTNSKTYHGLCCDWKECCADADTEAQCASKPKCKNICSDTTMNCVIKKAKFMDESYNFSNFFEGALLSNIDAIRSYCATGKQVINSGCFMDEYHPLNPACKYYEVYQKLCSVNPQCLTAIAQFNNMVKSHPDPGIDTLFDNNGNITSNGIAMYGEKGDGTGGLCGIGSSLIVNNCYAHYTPSSEFPPPQQNPTYIKYCS